ncbi:phage minor head protein [Pseudomonas sp. GX19020]|uniref:phage head morphogenesis protein n=1 Tax=Pseudomonas sp. GX19020 TaxID=2942277 RepID=UPI0020183F85|nr:phage minor head protein [Pseudomonas sp. GX19020]MCL4065918.1 phage minor head protein [Pseudomonas sp. GX19020]
MAGIELKPLHHREAIEYFRSKGFAPQLQRFHHLDTFREEHARNWVVAKAMRDDVSQAIRAEVDRALAEGRTLAQFQEDLAPRLKELGWWGKSLETDPLTGELTEVQLGSMRRLRVIFDTNMRTAHAAGHWARIQRTKRAFPYLQYIQIERPTKRHDHARFHGKIWHVDDPIWQRIYPPNGYFCGCTVRQLTEGQMQREGLTVSPPMDLDEQPWTNKRTGEVFQVPKGVNPGFDSNPGAAWLDLGKDWEEMTPDISSGARASGRGTIEGLRLRRLGDGRETLVVADSDGVPVSQRTADPASPDLIPVDGMRVPATPHFLRSHISEASLASDDLSAMAEFRASSFTAISPGGSIWRAVRNPDADIASGLAEFSSIIPEFKSELRAIEDPDLLFSHARMLWLENEGILTYHFRMSERVRQIMDADADLLSRMINARRLPR